MLPDVWIRYGMLHFDPDGERRRSRDETDAVDLLLTPHRNSSVADLSRAVWTRLRADRPPDNWKDWHGRYKRAFEIAHNQATVAVRLYLDELVRAILPLGRWWSEVVHVEAGPEKADLVAELIREPSLLAACLARYSRERADLRALREEEGAGGDGKRQGLRGRSGGPADTTRFERCLPFIWLVRVVGTLALIKIRIEGPDRARPEDLMRDLPGDHLETVEAFLEIIHGRPEITGGEPLLWTVSQNRPVTSSIARSVLTVKGDAARLLFNVSTENIAWAVIDSGIDATHRAFARRKEDGRGADGKAGQGEAGGGTFPVAPKDSRILETYDFTGIRGHLTLTDPTAVADEDDPVAEEEALRSLRRRLRSGKLLDWGLLRSRLRVAHSPDRDYEPPENDHGTHVAGILAGDWRKEEGLPGHADGDLCGVCPALELYDLRVLGPDGRGSEFAVMAALQFVRYLNQLHDQPKIHGVNLSLSMKHDVANYACGRTPVCEECERVVASGVVVVAAAGNDGYARFSTPTGDAEGYRAISIADPGNAEGVITVGATHRSEPHSFGVSYFSSRGPTGDGRRKPDLVAPGEKITAPVPNMSLATKDGTSMAAPHVSGAAALLMARHRELLGQPQRVKQILCSTSTDLGREPYFQGRGLVDILRALQSV